MQDKKGTILMVENDRDTRDMVEILLSQAGYNAVIVSSMAEGLCRARDMNLDLILLDWYLEDGLGIELCQRIRRFDQETPIFFYTGVSYPAEIRKAMQAGAQGCFIKPVDVNQLLQTIAIQIEGLKIHQAESRQA